MARDPTEGMEAREARSGVGRVEPDLTGSSYPERENVPLNTVIWEFRNGLKFALRDRKV